MWLLLLPSALAGDTWTTIRTGVDELHRTTSDPQDIYAVRIDLTVPNVGIHASADSDGVERHTVTSNFARNADVLVAINGDWSDSDTPVGLAISDGSMWHPHIPDDGVGGQWGYFACTATKECTITAELPLDQAWWFGTPTAAPYRYYEAVGANGNLLIVDGVLQSGCYDTAQNPRSAVCLEADGTTLWLVAIDGRTSQATGMTCDETRALLQGFGCYNAAMLDGGGSTSLVVDGALQNNPSDGAERTVSNFIGIIYSDPIDSACTVASGFWCDGSVISSCQGGRVIGSGDCAYYGASCAEEGDFAYCVDYRCPGGDGQAKTCTSDTVLAGCSDGAYSEGDCGVFGLVCGEDASGSSCMDPRCENGPSSAFCTDSGLYGACTDGVYAEGDCGYYGLVCWEGGGTGACVDPRCTAGPDSQTCSDAGVWETCAGGVYTEEDCTVNSQLCDTSAGCVDREAGGDSDGGTGGAGGNTPGKATALGGEDGCGCAAGAGGGWFGLIGILAVRRRG